jgi:hypothetical protein
MRTFVDAFVTQLSLASGDHWGEISGSPTCLLGLTEWVAKLSIHLPQRIADASWAHHDRRHV